MKRMTPACKLILKELKRKFRYYFQKKKLAMDGSFFCSDKNLSKDLDGLGINTVKRAKQFLVKNGYIKIVPGKYISKATKYWILEPPKMDSSPSIQEGTNLEQESTNLYAKATQNGSPTNNITDISNSAAGSASACPESQASPAFPVEAYKGRKIETQSELNLLLNYYGKDIVNMIKSKDLLLGEGVNLNEALKANRMASS